MIDNLIRETTLRFLNVLCEQSDEISELIKDPNNLDIIEEAIEVVIDESLRNFDDYISSLDETYEN